MSTLLSFMWIRGQYHSSGYRRPRFVIYTTPLVRTKGMTVTDSQKGCYPPPPSFPLAQLYKAAHIPILEFQVVKLLCVVACLNLPSILSLVPKVRVGRSRFVHLINWTHLGDTEPRLEIRDLYKDKHQWTLFIRAMGSIMDPYRTDQGTNPACWTQMGMCSFTT
jgi:hypothetical protein